MGAACECSTCEEFRQRLYAQICEQGYTTVAVRGRRGDPDWAHTVGLGERCDHPEFVVIGVPLGRSRSMLDVFARAVLDGERPRPGEELVASGRLVHLVEVHQRHIRRGLLRNWFDYYAAACRYDLEPRALQVVMPDNKHCHVHQTTQPLLDTAQHVILRPRRGYSRQRC